MVRSIRSKKRPRRWLFPVTAVLLTAAGIVLYRCPPSLQDIGRIFQSAVGKISSLSAGPTPADPVLRGTIYDRKFNELAVSYKLYSLQANPVEVIDRHQVAQALAPLIEQPEEKLEARLKSTQDSMVLATDLDERQAQQINALQLRGITCKATDARFYPGHTAASHVLGFMGDGVGLAGVEGKYDSVLRGVFRQGNIADIDFQGQEHLGDDGADLVLTLDIGLQKLLENRFREFLSANGTEKGMGLLIEPGSGRILALMNQPSFNPNYFWKANESTRVNRIYNHVLDKELIRPVLARAAAINREGLEGPPLLPRCIAAPDYGFSDQQLAAFEQQIQLYGSVFGNWESGPATEESEQQQVVTGVQVGVTLASLVNGGWRITPYVVDSLYDHATATRYTRSSEATTKSHVLDPALGVKIRRELFADWTSDQENGVVFTAQRTRIAMENNLSRYSKQELFVALAPAKHPRYLLLIAIERDHLLPDQPGRPEEGSERLDRLGRELLVSLAKGDEQEVATKVPTDKSPENRRQFFISKRLNFKDRPDKHSEAVARMPQMRGMSLRKGLQQISQYKMKVRVNGSGRIVAQYPLAGQPLTGINECIVTLESR